MVTEFPNSWNGTYSFSDKQTKKDSHVPVNTDVENRSKDHYVSIWYILIHSLNMQSIYLAKYLKLASGVKFYRS